jgi:hypothetical protein
MQQLVAAARAGDLEAAQQIQSKLWEVTRRPRRPAGHRRVLLPKPGLTMLPIDSRTTQSISTDQSSTPTEKGV